MSDENTQHEPVIACNLNAMTAAQRPRYDSIRAWMSENAQSVTEQPEGFSLHYDTADSTLMRLAEFITLERLCCPFLHFSLHVSPSHEGVVLKLSGGAAIKEYLAGILSLTTG